MSCHSGFFDKLPVLMRPFYRTASKIHLLLFLAGAFASFVWLKSFGWFVVVGTALLVTTVHATTMLPRRHRWGRWLRWTGLTADLAVHLFWLYCLVSFGSMLSWAVPGWLQAGLALLAAVSVINCFRGQHIWVPIALPMGLWIGACLLGWVNEDGLVRCDDFLRLTREGKVHVVLPTHSTLEQCRSGDVFQAHRYPRRIWEYPDQQRLLFTTQRGIVPPVDEAPSASRELDGSICEVTLDGRRSVRCIGTGKAEGIAESERHDRVYVAEWMSSPEGKGGKVFSFSRTGPLNDDQHIELERKSVSLFYDPTDDMLGVFFDDMEGLLPLRAADLAPGPVTQAPFLPADIIYDPVRREGLLCFAPTLLYPFERRAAAAVAFSLAPFSARHLASSDHYPWAWGAMVWGCQFDSVGRTAWVMLANAGVLLTIDWDTGRLRDWHWVGFGARKTVHDPVRRRLYIADFLRGDVIVWDLDRNEEIARHFAGRFLRGLSLSRDGRTLWMGSSLGVLALPLDDPTDSADTDD